MKGSLKWIVLYNCRLPNNHPRLFKQCKEFERQGKLKMYNYKKFIKNKQQILDLMDNCEEDALDIVPLHQKEYIGNLELNKGIDKMIHAPKTYLKSTISLWYCPEWNKYTRMDIGAKELKYLIKSEKRMPKWI